MTDKVFSRSLLGEGTMVRGDDAIVMGESGDLGDAGGLIGRSR